MSGSSRVLIATLLLLSPKVKGSTPFTFFNGTCGDTLSSNNISFGVAIGSELYNQKGELEQELNRLFGIDQVDNVLTKTSLTIKIPFPGNKHGIIGGIQCVYVKSQTLSFQGQDSTRYLSFSGFSYGPSIEITQFTVGNVEIHTGLRLLQSSLRMDISQTDKTTQNPSTVFSNSKSLDLSYRSNQLNPFLSVDYPIRLKKSNHNLLVGICIDYKYILPASFWKLPSIDYDTWYVTHSKANVDLPFFGEHVFGLGLSITYR